MIPMAFKYRGERGTLEILPEGTVEREAAAAGERIYQLHELPELLNEIRQGTAAGTVVRVQEQLGMEEAPEPVPVPAVQDAAAGAALADEGMSKALRAARVTAWRQTADQWLLAVDRGTLLTADDLTAAVGLPDVEGEGQNRNNVLGGWFNSKAKAGLIVWHGRVSKSVRPERHGNQQRVWVRT